MSVRIIHQRENGYIKFLLDLKALNLLREDILQCIDLKINFVVVYVNPDQFRTIL